MSHNPLKIGNLIDVSFEVAIDEGDDGVVSLLGRKLDLLQFPAKVFFAELQRAVHEVALKRGAPPSISRIRMHVKINKLSRCAFFC